MTPTDTQVAGDGIPNAQPVVQPAIQPAQPEIANPIPNPAEPETPKNKQFKELRARKDELLRITAQQQQELEELNNKLKDQAPALPEPVLASLREFAPDMAPDAAVAHIMDDYRRKTQTLNEREALLQQLDIEHSEV